MNRVITEEEFKLFYEQTSPGLLAYLRRVAQDAALADDVFQEAFIRLLRSDLRESGHAARKSFLYAVATNLLRDHWRRAKKSVRWDDVENIQPMVEPVNGDPGVRMSLEKAFGRLAPLQRSLLWLAYVEACSHKEIAAALDLREKSVKVLLFRAKNMLSGILQSMGIRKEEML